MLTKAKNQKRCTTTRSKSNRESDLKRRPSLAALSSRWLGIYDKHAVSYNDTDLHEAARNFGQILVRLLIFSDWLMKSIRLRFRLRTILVLLTIAAIVSAYFGNQWYIARMQTAAIDAIKSIGGKMIQDEEMNATRVLFSGAEFDNSKLKKMAMHLKYLPELDELDFVKTQMTDDAVEILIEVIQIKTLYLFETSMTQAGIDELRKRMPEVDVKIERPDPISSGMASMPVYSHAMVALDWTPDGNCLATGSGDGVIRLWDFETNSAAHQWKAHKNWAFSVAFSPDGNTIATGGGDDLVKLWDASTFELKAELSGHTDDVHSVAFTPDGKSLVSSGDDRTIRFWDLETLKLTRVLEGHSEQIPSIAIGPNGKYLASASRDNTVRLWEIATGETIAVLPTDYDDVNSVAFDSKARFLASGDQGGMVKVWDLESHELLTTLEGHNGKVYRVAFDESDERLYSCGDDGIRRWSIKEHKSQPIGRPQRHVSNLMRHPTQDLIASTNVRGELHLMNSESGETLRVLRTMFGERGFDLE